MRREPTEHRGMRDVALRNLGRAAFILALCAIAPSTSGRADDLVRQGLQAKLDYCTTCHGPSGQGYRGYFAIPRLAGQRAGIGPGAVEDLAASASDRAEPAAV